MKVAIELEDDGLVVCCDRQLMVMLLTQYIDNACKYSIFGTTITIRVSRPMPRRSFPCTASGR
jgi:two-component system sensor histidine kinase KdpD